VRLQAPEHVADMAGWECRTASETHREGIKVFHEQLRRFGHLSDR